MIVDCHTHIWRAEHWSAEGAGDSARAKAGPIDPEVTWEAHWKAMEVVDRAIVFGLRAQHVGLVVPNDFVADYVKGHPDKLIGFTSIDPNESDYMDELHRSVEDLGLRGVKLGPIYQNYHPMDERARPVYEYCQTSMLPILIHQGATFPRRAPLKFASPVQLEDVALAYPDLKMVIAHLGHPWIEEAIVLIRKQPNLYADISALHYRPWQFYNGLVCAKEYGVLDKLLFGSDFPFTTPVATIEALRDFNSMVAGTNLPRLTVEEIEGLIQSPTLTFLGLN
jgi:uncharacterized protein